MAAPTILFGTTAPEAVWFFLREHALHMADHGWEVHVVTSPDPGFERVEAFFSTRPNLHLHGVSMRRSPAPLHDLGALIAWIKVLRRIDPQIVLVGTPKAGLVGLLASWIVRVPVRIYFLLGLRLETQHGLARVIGWLAERSASSAATNILAVSPSLLREYSAKGLADEKKITVLNSGSTHGVKTHFYRPCSEVERQRARRRLNIPDAALVVGFAGRMTKDKGVDLLLRAFESLQTKHENLWLLLTGEIEDSEIGRLVSEATALNENVRVTRWMSDMRDFYWVLDISCLPSLREGLPNVNLEAAACGLPVVSTTATGCRDSLVRNVSGLLAVPGDAESLQVAIAVLVDDPSQRQRMGTEGRVWVVENFDENQVRQSLETWLSSLVR